MTIDSEQAWNDFVEQRSFEKSTSIQGQLDTITSMLSDIKTDTERAAAASTMQPEMPPEAPMGAPMGDEALPEMEDLGEPSPEEGLDDTVAPADMEDGMQGVPSEMPPEAPENFEEPPIEETPSDIPAEAGGDIEGDIAGTGYDTGFEEDMVSQIKTMIATTDDAEQLKGLSKLLSTALSQSRPAVPMQGNDTVQNDEPVGPMMKCDQGNTTNDGEAIIKEALSGAVDSTLGVGFSKSEDVEETISVSEEPVPEVPEDADAIEEAPVAESEGDQVVDQKIEELATKVAEEVAAVVEEAIGADVDAKAEENAEDAPAEAPAEEVEEKTEEKSEDKDDKSENEEKNEEISEKTESFEESCDDKPMFKSAADMFAERMHVGVDGMPNIVKAAPEAAHVPDTPAESDKAPEDVADDTMAEATDGADIIDEMNAASIGKSLPTAAEMFNSAFSKTDTEEDIGVKDSFSDVPAKLAQEDAEKAQEKAKVEGKFADVDRGAKEVPTAVGTAEEATEALNVGKAPEKKSASDAGIHLKSFAEMYSDKGGFTKAEEIPDTKAAYGGQVGKPDLTDIKKSADQRKPLQIGYGVDPHEAVADDWARYFALKDAGQL